MFVPRSCGRMEIIMTHIHYASAIQVFTFAALSSDTCQVTGLAAAHDEALTVLVIPEFDQEGRRVVAVADRAFFGLSFLRRVDLPSSIETIGVRAFAFCTNLMEVRFGSGNARTAELRSIGDRAFMGCECLTVLSLGELRQDLTCGKKAFAYCPRLRAAILPVGMTELSEGIFEGCRSLMYVHLPEALRVIHTSAFSSCVSLCHLTLPAHLNRVDDCAFSFCSSLEAVDLPEKECMFSATAFLDCPATPDFMRVG